MPDVEKRTDSQATTTKVLIGLAVTALVVVFAGFIFVNARRLGWTLGWIYVSLVATTLRNSPFTPSTRLGFGSA